MPITRQIAAQIRAHRQRRGRPGPTAAVGTGAGRPTGGQPEHDPAGLRAADGRRAFRRRHGDGTFVADHVPSGQMKAQRQLLRQQVARTAELARTLG